MSWVFITLSCIAFACFALLFSAISNIKFSPKPSAGSKEVDHEVTREMFKKIVTFFRKFDLDMARSVCSEMFFHSIKTELSGLSRFGIRKDIIFTENTEMAKSNVNLKINDGKNSFTVDIMYGDYEEKYVDTASNKELYSKHIPVSNANLYMIQAEEGQAKESFYCSNCGNLLNIKTDSTICPSCGTAYNTESNSWSVTDLQVMDLKRNNRQTGLLGSFAIILVTLSLVGHFIIPEATYTVLMIVLNSIVVLSGLFFIYYINKALKPLREISKHDKNFSRMIFQARVEYLVNLYFKSKYFNPQLIKPFSSIELVEQLNKEFTQDKELIIDLDVGKKLIRSLEVSDNHIVVTMELKLTSVVVNKNKKVRRRKSKAIIKLSRHISAKTKVYTDADYLTCEGCSASINLAADGKCKYCGNPIDVSKYDWILTGMN